TAKFTAPLRASLATASAAASPTPPTTSAATAFPIVLPLTFEIVPFASLVFAALATAAAEFLPDVIPGTANEGTAFAAPPATAPTAAATAVCATLTWPVSESWEPASLIAAPAAPAATK